jgi:hypothetical protein
MPLNSNCSVLVLGRLSAHVKFVSNSWAAGARTAVRLSTTPTSTTRGVVITATSG